MNKKMTGLLFTLLIGAFGVGFATEATAQVSINIGTGWHGDRYYDGHRYWSRDEWNRRHPPHHVAPHHGPMGHDDHHDDHNH